jgi:F-type H+-transporting ATPase subunit delta
VSIAHRTYARALFQAAKERNRLEQVGEELAQFVEAAREVRDLRGLLRNPQLDPRAKTAVLKEVLADADELVRNFLLLVVEKGRSAEIDEIYQEFERFVAAEEGRVKVELTTAVDLSEKDAQAIVEQIEKASGQTVEATRSVDPELIGGMVLQVGSLRLDGSIRGRLDRLRHELVQRS